MNTAPALRRVLLAAIAASALVLAGCAPGNTPPSIDDPPQGDSGIGAPGDSPGGDNVDDAVVVPVAAFEYGYEFANLFFSAGTFQFELENMGTMPHNMVIQGPGVDEATRILEPGETATLTVTLESGTYEIWCAVAGHRAEGMEMTIQVT